MVPWKSPTCMGPNPHFSSPAKWGHSPFGGINPVFLVFVLEILKCCYCCSSTVVSILPPPCPTTPAILTFHPRTYTLWFCPCVLYTSSLMALPLISPLITLPAPLCLQSVYSLLNVFGHILLACFFC